MKKILFVILVFITCVLISQAQAISNIIITPNSFTVPTNQQIVSYDATTGVTSFSTSSITNNNVVDIYDQVLGDYSLPINASASSVNNTIANNPITLDTETSGGSTASSFTPSITIGNHNFRILIATLSYNPTAGGTTFHVHTVKIGSTSFTLVSNATNSATNSRVEVWKLLSPSTGSQTVTITATGSVALVYGLTSLYNVDQANGIYPTTIATNGQGNGYTGPWNVSIIPTTPGSWVFGVFGITSQTISSISNTQDYKINTPWVSAMAHNTSPTIGGSNTLSVTLGSSPSSYQSAAFEVLDISQFSAVKSIDGDTGTEWKSNAVTHPRLTLDTGSSNIISGLAIYPDKTKTNETQILVKTSLDNSTFVTKRTINISSLTNGTWNYIRWDLDNQTMRYVQIYGASNTNVILAIPEIHVLEPSITNLLLRHGHELINSTDPNTPLNQ